MPGSWTNRLGRPIIALLRSLDIAVTRESTLQRLLAKERLEMERPDIRFDITLLLQLPHDHVTRLIDLLPKSKSQLRQDFFVLSELNFKRDGFFVEFGACNGVDHSNSYILEKEFGWTGIIAEPARSWQKELDRNRSCHIDHDCVWSITGANVLFYETSSRRPFYGWSIP